MSDIKNKLKNLASKNKSNWLEDAKKREENAFWIEYSQKIALGILMQLRKLDKTQTWLAEQLEVSPQQVNKIVRGEENLGLKTIRQIELILMVKLISVGLEELAAAEISAIKVGAEKQAITKKQKEKASTADDYATFSTAA
jgi:hypothetical protein